MDPWQLANPKPEEKCQNLPEEKCNSDLDLAIIRSTDNPLAVKPDAPDQLLVTLQNPETSSALDVPEPDGVVGTSADDEPVVVLEARDTPLVTVQCADKLAGARGPNLDGSISTGGDDVLLIKVNYIHSRSETKNIANL